MSIRVAAKRWSVVFALGLLTGLPSVDVRAQDAAVALSADAQRTLQSSIGKNIWLTSLDGTTITGVLKSASATSLQLSGDGGSREVQIAGLRRIEVARSRMKAVILGAAIGGGGGAALGIMSATTSDGTEGVGTVVGLAGPLGVAGGFLGYAMSAGRVVVYSTGPKVAVSPQIGTGHLGASLRVRW